MKGNIKSARHCIYETVYELNDIELQGTDKLMCVPQNPQGKIERRKT
jgi:hypothetical protein